MAYDCNYVPRFDGYKPDKIIVSLGTNGYQNEGRQERIEAFYKRLHEVFGDTPVLSIAPLWRPDIVSEQIMLDLNAIIKRESEKYGYFTLDGFSLLPHIKELFHDKVHPNVLGMQIYGRNLADEIKRLKF